MVVWKRGPLALSLWSAKWICMKVDISLASHQPYIQEYEHIGVLYSQPSMRPPRSLQRLLTFDLISLIKLEPIKMSLRRHCASVCVLYVDSANKTRTRQLWRTRIQSECGCVCYRTVCDCDAPVEETRTTFAAPGMYVLLYSHMYAKRSCWCVSGGCYFARVFYVTLVGSHFIAFGHCHFPWMVYVMALLVLLYKYRAKAHTETHSSTNTNKKPHTLHF